jgi:hypothetical protein
MISNRIYVSYNGRTHCFTKHVTGEHNGEWYWWKVQFNDDSIVEDIKKDRDVMLELVKVYNSTLGNFAGMSLEEFITTTIKQ